MILLKIPDTLKPVLQSVLEHKDTMLIKVTNTIATTATTTNNIDYKSWISTGIAITLFVYTIWDKIKWPTISGKILSMTYSPKGQYSGIGVNGEKVEFSGIKYFFKISINVTRTNVYYKDLKIYVKYPQDNNKYEGKIYYSINDEWTFDGTPKKLTIPSDKFLPFNNVLEKEKVLFFYVTFFVVKPDYELFEEIEIAFVDAKGRERKMQKLTSKEIKSELFLFEREIWV